MIELADLGALRFTGIDAVRFLQGQLSNDVTRLAADRALLAGYHNPQGRVIALLHLVQLAENDLLAVLPRELAPAVVSRLSKFVLRSKVKIADESGKWRVKGLVRGGAMSASAEAGARIAAGELPLSLHGVGRVGSSVVVCVDENAPRWLVISSAEQPAGQLADWPADLAALFEQTQPGDLEVWRRLDIAAGVPQVHAATTEEFVAQMLNLDVLAAIAFDKGCYTGQEVIARAHYRGRVKRRAQRFASRGVLQLKAGDSAHLSDGRSAKVVDAVQLPDGRCEFLAVTSFSADTGESGAPGQSAAATESVAVEQASVDVEQLDLPYALPE